MIYQALKPQTVQIVGGLVDVKKGTLVAFDHDPGAGWKEVEDGSDPRESRRAVG